MFKANGSVVVSTLEFDVAWEASGLPDRHVALDVPSPGRTHTERRELVAQAWRSLGERGLADGTRLAGDLLDRLTLLANADYSIDSWVWTDRQISGLAAVAGESAVFAVVDADEVWLIPTRRTAVTEAAVSIAGDRRPGPGRSVSVLSDLLTSADAQAQGEPHATTGALEALGVELTDAQEVVSMLAGTVLRGQCGVQRRGRDRRLRRAGRVVAFHDTPDGRYLYLRRPGPDGRDWSTVTPADNRRLAMCVGELLDEV